MQKPSAKSNDKSIESDLSTNLPVEAIPPTMPVPGKPDTTPPAQPLEKKPEKMVPKKHKSDSNQLSITTQPNDYDLRSEHNNRKESYVFEEKPSEQPPSPPGLVNTPSREQTVRDGFLASVLRTFFICFVFFISLSLTSFTLFIDFIIMIFSGYDSFPCTTMLWTFFWDKIIVKWYFSQSSIGGMITAWVLILIIPISGVIATIQSDASTK